MSGRNVPGWFVVVLLLGVVAYALAEDLTLTTYYPSPRGVYQELRASGNVAIGTTAAPQARLQVVRTTDATSLALLVEDAPNDPTPFVLDETGKLGLGTRDPTGPLTITGAMTDPVGGTCPAGYEWYNEDGDGTIDPQECRQTTLVVQADGNIGIGTSTPGAYRLKVAGPTGLDDVVTLTNTDAAKRRITNVATPPVADSDVVTKAYVDAAAGGGGEVDVWGTTTCPNGWTRVYAGTAIVPYLYTYILLAGTNSQAATVGVGGHTLCSALNPAAVSQNGWLIWAAPCAASHLQSGTFVCDNALSCAVCVK